MPTRTEPIPIFGQTQWRSAADVLGSPHEPVRSLYIHVPFCFHKCHYCDFYSFVDSQDRQESFVDALLVEIESLALHADQVAGLSTIFIGGGTPSLLRPDLWRRLLDAIHTQFKLDQIRAGDGEFTVECNPETVTSELMTILKAGGVNRVSVGAQSFNESHLKTLERWHDPANVAKALNLADDAGIERRSIDLIYAIPGQTMDDVASDLDAALSLSPGVEHISAYCLTYEPNTAMTRRVERGDIQPVDDDTCADMQTLVADTLRGAGFHRYEVSNFARRDETGDHRRAVSQHNLAYWRNQSWLAAGPSASGHVMSVQEGLDAPAGVRWKNAPRLTDWMEYVNATGASPVIDVEAPDAERTLRERLMMGIRIDEGVLIDDVRAAAQALNCEAPLLLAVAQLIRNGMLEDDAKSWRLTDRGFLFADGVAAELMSAVVRS